MPLSKVLKRGKFGSDPTITNNGPQLVKIQVGLNQHILTLSILDISINGKSSPRGKYYKTRSVLDGRVCLFWLKIWKYLLV